MSMSSQRIILNLILIHYRVLHVNDLEVSLLKKILKIGWKVDRNNENIAMLISGSRHTSLVL